MRQFLFCLVLIVFAGSTCHSQNHPPKAVNDYGFTTHGILQFNLLFNDYDVDGDSIFLYIIYKNPKHGTVEILDSKTIEYLAYSKFSGGYDTLFYIIKDNRIPSLNDTGILYLTVDKSLMVDSVSVNNIIAGVSADGTLFQDVTFPDGLYEVPAGSGKSTLYVGHLWFGGVDINGLLHLAAERYFHEHDFWAGPVSSVYDSNYDKRFKRVWKIKKSDIDYHLGHCWQAGYIPAQNLKDWPGNGDTALGQSAIIAPFYDWNNDGFYDPNAGDYPLIKGDESVLFVFNDARYPHAVSEGAKLGLEIRGMLYAFHCPADSALWNTVFIHFDIVNRSTYTYYDAVIGTFMDIDIGNAYDDYIACDVTRGSFNGYNGDNNDGNGNPLAYGMNCPVQSVTLLGGPYMDPDGLDNPRYDNFGNIICDVGINGLNFGDGTIDNERFGLSRFLSFNNVGLGFWALQDPEGAADYYNLMRGIWKDGQHVSYWGYGHPLYGGSGPECSFMFPGSSDTCHWGTNGINPGDSIPWTEIQAGNMPYDRRGLGVTGPFTFYPGATEELDLAFVFARNFADTNATAAIPIMQQRIDSVRKYFINDMTPCGGGFSAIKPKPKVDPSLKIYPNPSDEVLTVEFYQEGTAQFEILDILGKKVRCGDLDNSGKTIISIYGIPDGMYFLKVTDDKNKITRKFIKN